jgi:hypothetical protein
MILVHVLLLGSLLINSAIEVKDRHFWPVGAILIPGVLRVLFRTNLYSRVALMISVACQLLLGVPGFWTDYEGSVHAGRSASLNISFKDVSQHTVDTLERLDQINIGQRKLFFFVSPTLAVCIRSSAVAVGAAKPWDRPYEGVGKLGYLALVLPEDVVQQRTAIGVESVFPGGTKWKITQLGDYEILSEGPKAPL